MTTMAKSAVLDPADPKVRLQPLLSPPREPVLVEVPEVTIVAGDGKGSPETGPANDAGFQEALGAIFSVAYGLHFALKREGLERSLMPLEALWWSDGGGLDLSPEAAAGWNWRAFMIVPDEATPERFEAMRAEAARKKDLPGLARLRLERWTEGRCAQVMHVGPYSEEKPTIEKLHAFIAGCGLRMRGRHHEIYLGDPRRSAPDKLKTILRQPVE
jgi:hypothetical protein